LGSDDNVKDTIGLIGLGNMGAAVAERLLLKYDVIGFDTSDERCDAALARGMRIASSAVDVSAESSTIVLSLPHPKISAATVHSLLTGGPRPDTLIIETSTILPADARAAAELCAGAHVQYVDAAILSGVQSVAAGTTLLLVGGSDAAVHRAQSALDAITTNRRRLGDVGAGMAAKVINNAVAHDVYVVLSEAVAMGQANGITIATLVDVLGDPEGGMLRPLHHRIAERLAQRNFEGGMPVDAARKDSQLALDLAQAGGVPLFATQATHTVYEIAVAAGMGRLDYSAVATLWHDWAAAGNG
jgi:3-hydroxyisobutyrate dehydrogenase-like beta-hydroxyacid dehydrogenase